MSWLSELVKDAALNKDPVTISQDPDGDGVFIRGRGFGMEFPKAVKLGLTKVTDMLRAKDMPLAPCEFQNGAVCYIPVPGCTGVVVVQPQARATRFLKRLPVHEDGCEEEDDDEVDCECAGPFRLSTRVNTEGCLTVVDRPGKSSVYVPVKPPKHCVELETACAICLTPENVKVLLYIFESHSDSGDDSDGGAKDNKRKAEDDCEDCEAKKPRC
jgi:hypothetical protein